MKSAALMSVLLIAALPGQASPVKNFRKALPLASNGKVSIDTHNGSVSVTTWNQTTVDVTARIEPEDRWGDAEDVHNTDVRMTGGGDSVVIESDYSAVSSHFFGWLGFGDTSYPLVHYTIRMPSTASLKIDNHNSSVTVAGLHNDLLIRSHNGSIDIRDLDGVADVETHNGSARISFAQFKKASRLSTHNGSFEVRVPPASRFTVDVEAHKHDPVTSDFALARDHGDESEYVARVNGGGPVLRFSAHNGSLRLGKQ